MYTDVLMVWTELNCVLSVCLSHTLYHLVVSVLGSLNLVGVSKFASNAKL